MFPGLFETGERPSGGVDVMSSGLFETDGRPIGGVLVICPPDCLKRVDGPLGAC